MSMDVAITRRAFLGASAVVVAAGAGFLALPRARRGEALRFDRQGGFPDGPVVAEAELRGLPAVAVGTATLVVTTPRETLSWDLGEVRLEGGSARVETALTYPYEERVPGAYSYELVLEVAGRRLRTAAPATFSVRDIVWFA